MIVKIPLLPLLQRLLQGSLQQEEVEEPHRRCTQRSNMNYQLTPEAPDHLTLATLPFFPEQCNHCGKNFLRKLSLSKHMLVEQDTWPSWWHAEGSASSYAKLPSRLGSALRNTWRGVLICWHLDMIMLKTGLWGNSGFCWIESVSPFLHLH